MSVSGFCWWCSKALVTREGVGEVADIRRFDKNVVKLHKYCTPDFEEWRAECIRTAQPREEPPQKKDDE